jgi:putative transposase
VPAQARWAAGGFLPRLSASLEQLDLLLLTVAQSCKVRQDGIHFHGLCYLDPILAAYVGEQVIIRYDPQDMAESRVFHQHRFLRRATCPELAGDTSALPEIIQARNHRRKALRHTLHERTRTVEALLEAHRGSHQGDAPLTNAPASTREKDTIRVDTPQFKRYFNE